MRIIEIHGNAWSGKLSNFSFFFLMESDSSWTDRAYRNPQIDRPESPESAHVPIVDANIIARQVVEPGTSGPTFEDEILHPDGTLERSWAASSSTTK